MTRDEVRKPIIQLFERFGSGDWENTPYILESFADDGEWWVLGPAGTMTKAQMLEALKMARFGSQGGLSIKLDSWIIEGDRAAIEAHGEMPLADGSVYRNLYHFAIQVKNGKVWRVRDYMDTMASSKLVAYQQGVMNEMGNK